MNTRPPAVAGRFYPDSPTKLTFAVQALLDEALPPRDEAALGLIVPHAGYLFSGPIAADAFKQIIGHTYDLIVIFGTNHTARHLDSVAFPSSQMFATPFGSVKVQHELARSLVNELPECIEDDHPHEVEHSIEVQLPFLQIVAPEIPILPMIVGIGSPELCYAFGEKLARHLTGKNVLYIASSDLSHYPTKETAHRLDHEALDAVTSLDFKRLQSVIQIHPRENGEPLLTRACGSSPIEALLGAVEASGCKSAVEISYANSGDTLFCEDERVVGYGAIAFYQEATTTTSTIVATLPLDKSLLHFARRTLEMNLGGDVVPLPRGFSPEGNAHRGVFVSLYNRGKLRGCVGHVTSDDPLCLTVGKMALAAAGHDWRFPPVEAKELPEITIEISALTEPVLILRIDEIEPGRDGVMIRKGGNRGVFLPKVAEEQGWNREQLLEHLCDKADLPRGSWREGAELLTFQAEVFRE